MDTKQVLFILYLYLEFMRFEKKHYPRRDLTNKKNTTPEINRRSINEIRNYWSFQIRKINCI
jgi:hypothetical protein